MILIIYPQQYRSVYDAFVRAFATRIPSDDTRPMELTCDSTVTKLRYDLRESYYDVTAIIYLPGEMTQENSPLAAEIIHFAAQQSLPMFLISTGSLTADGGASDSLRRTAEALESLVSKNFTIGLAPVESQGFGLATAVAGLLDSGWFGRFHVQADGGMIGFDPVQRRNVSKIH